MNPKTKIKYHATSKDMIKEIPAEINASGYWLEFNPNIGMWRLNRKGGVPLEIAGYSPHKQALIERVKK